MRSHTRIAPPESPQYRRFPASARENIDEEWPLRVAAQWWEEAAAVVVEFSWGGVREGIEGRLGCEARDECEDESELTPLDCD